MLIRPVGLDEARKGAPSVLKERDWTGSGWEKVRTSVFVRRLQMWIRPEWRPIPITSSTGDCAREVTGEPKDSVSNI